MSNLANRTNTQPQVKQQNSAKISPEAMQLVFMDEIAGRLSDLHELNKEMFQSQKPSGETDYFEINVKSIPKIYSPEKGQKWFSVEIINTGDSDLYFLSNGQSQQSDTPKLSPRTSFNLNPQHKVISHIMIWCESNTSTTAILTCMK